MLILSRRRDQRIYVGESIVIEVRDLDRDTVWLGVHAPHNVTIVREEVLLARLAAEREGRAHAERRLDTRGRPTSEGVTDGQTL